jgi:hypothetical protein
LSIRNYYWFTGWCAWGSRRYCGKERLPGKERPVKENEGDVDLRSVRILERRQSEEGANIRGNIK